MTHDLHGRLGSGGQAAWDIAASEASLEFILSQVLDVYHLFQRIKLIRELPPHTLDAQIIALHSKVKAILHLHHDQRAFALRCAAFHLRFFQLLVSELEIPAGACKPTAFPLLGFMSAHVPLGAADET